MNDKSNNQARKFPTRFRKRVQCREIYFTSYRAHSSQRRRHSSIQNKEPHNLRAAIEATVQSVKHPFPTGKLPVRGLFRMACVLIASAGMTHVRRIQYYLKAEIQPGQLEDFFLYIGKGFQMIWISRFQSTKLYRCC
jgi:hypothetical protein